MKSDFQKNRLLYPGANWIKKEEIARVEAIRKQFIEKFEQLGGKTKYKRTKYFTHALSPGCLKCGAGDWSCLFINNKCNANCFYCPTSQDKMDVPTTSTLPFSKTKEYLTYFQHGNFTGFSISGGEPFLTFEKSLEFLKAMQNRFGNQVYKWLYTNGILFTEEKAIALQKAGLNEIRFDLSAINYNLEPLKIARNYFEIVTIEIPAIPEDEEKVMKLLKAFFNIGVDFLNLHQLRATPHNYLHLKKREYTFLHGKHATILESELTAFRIMNYNLENDIKMAINYCSYIYKNRFQNTASRYRWATLWKEPLKEITENGYLRTISVQSDDALRKKLLEMDSEKQFWFDKQTTLQLHSDVCMSLQVKKITIEYFSIQIVNHPTYHFPFQEIELSAKRSVFLEKRKVDSMTVSISEFLVIKENSLLESDSSSESSKKLSSYETIASGLLPYC